MGKIVEKNGFLSIFNLLTKSNLSRDEPVEKYIDDLISSIGLLKVSLYLFQIYLAKQINSENKKRINKREDTSDILIDIDNQIDFPEFNYNIPNNNNYSPNINNMRMNMNNSYLNNNYIPNINQMPYNQNYS